MRPFPLGEGAAEAHAGLREDPVGQAAAKNASQIAADADADAAVRNGDAAGRAAVAALLGADGAVDALLAACATETPGGRAGDGAPFSPLPPVLTGHVSSLLPY